MEEATVDLAFVVGPIGPKPKKAIFRFIRRVTQSWKCFQVASIHFTTQYDSNLCKNVFHSRTLDFENSYDPVTMSEIPQVQGNPLQHVSKLSFRENAVKICFLLTNVLPFHESCGEDNSGFEDNDHNKTSSKSTEVYHEDPLFTCHHLATMGVTLYYIEINQWTTIYRDIYSAFTFITGGQFISIDKITHLQKALRKIILEELSLVKLIGQVRDYLCVTWHKWGKKEARKPESMECLIDNVFNHMLNINTMTHEVLFGLNCPQQPNKLAMKIAALYDVSEARNISVSGDNWCSELNWIPQVCDEVIPGYNDTKKQNTQVISISEIKLVSRNQVARLVKRTLSRRPEYKQQKVSMTTAHVNKDAAISVCLQSSSHVMDNDNKTLNKNQEETFETMKKSKQDELNHVLINCKQEALINKNVQDYNKEQICTVSV